MEGREGGWKRGWVGGQGNRNNNNKVLNQKSYIINKNLQIYNYILLYDT